MDRTSIQRSFISGVLVTALLGGGAVVGVVVGSGAPALAQAQPAASPSPAAPSHRPRMGEALKSLNLSDDQKAQIRSIIADARKENADVTDRDTRRANMKAAYDKVDAVLTPDQRTQLHAKLDAMRAQNQSAHPQ